MEVIEIPREKMLAFMVGLCSKSGEVRAAEGYLLELLALVAFKERPAPKLEGWQ